MLATKVYFPMGPGPNDGGLSRKHILAGIDASLRRLGVDYVDLYQIHRWDPNTPIEETMGALHDVVRVGKGPLHRRVEHVRLAVRQGPARGRPQLPRFVSMQNHYNLVYREEEREMIPLCLDQGVGVIPWSPLARGFLTGNRTRDGQRHTVRASSDPFTDELYTDADFDVVDQLVEVAQGRGLPPAQVALAWLLHKPGVTAPIVGATKLAHLDDAVAAVDVPLSDDEIKRLEQPYQPHPILGHE